MNEKASTATGPIGVFDSGYGGLTILSEIRRALPGYDYIYLGDNARAPYGSRSFDLVYRFTLDAVRQLFDLGCPLVILACNTASAKALRSIQQRDLPIIDPTRRVLGVIRPTVEKIGDLTRNGHIGLFGTPGTVTSGSYDIEIAKINPDFKFSSHACPMWVPLVENREADRPGADYFVRQEVDALFAKDPDIDTVILGCTHYPLLTDVIGAYMGPGVTLLDSGAEVAEELAGYLREHDLRADLTQRGACRWYVSDSVESFHDLASIFLDREVTEPVEQIAIDKF